MDISTIGIIIFTIIVGLVGLLYFVRRWQHSKLTKLGIPHPPTHWLLGNLIDLKLKKTLPEVLQEFTRRYGKIWGYYEGPIPTIVTSDPDLLLEVFVKQFSGFHGRKLFPMQANPDTTPNVDMFMARGDKWKRLRTTINPAFSEKNMRQMFPLVDGCLMTMLKQLEMSIVEESKKKEATSSSDSKEKEKSAETLELNIYQNFQALTLDVICESAFGVQIRSQENPNHPFIRLLRQFFGAIIFKFSIITFVSLVLPELRAIFTQMFILKRKFDKSPIISLKDSIEEVIQAKRQSDKIGSNQRVDLLQLMLDAEVQSASGETSECPAMATNGTSGSSRIGKTLSAEEVKSQALLFLFAGYETSSTALGYAAHALAINPNIHQRLVDEIDSAYNEMSEADQAEGNPRFYEILSRLPYLDAFLMEVLRFHPFTALVVNRKCMKPGGLQVGPYHIPEGVNVSPDIYSIHFDPELWGPIDPKVFNPERFLSETTRHPMAFLAFGAGPRICIGQRLAVMEMKTCLARLLHRYSLERGEQTVDELPVRVGGTITPRDGVWVRIKRRCDQ